LRLSGAWRLGNLPVIQRELTALSLPAQVSVDGAALAVSTASRSAAESLRTAGVDVSGLPLAGFAANDARIVEQVRKRLEEINAPAEHRHEGLVAHVGHETLSVLSL
jgi:hypothetical protein